MVNSVLLPKLASVEPGAKLLLQRLTAFGEVTVGDPVMLTGLAPSFELGLST
jgi:hypothetical protein